MKNSKIFLSFLGLGYLPLIPISSTTIAWFVGLAIIFTLGAKTLFTLTFATFVISIFEINKVENSGISHNASWIVIDEMVGVWVAMSVGITALSWLPNKSWILYTILISSLLSYLLFILWSPSTIAWIRKNIKGGLGVMLDDALAGFAGGLLVLAIAKGFTLFS